MNRDNGLPLAGVNSFGFGGTNAHAVLQAPPATETPEEREADGQPCLVPLSAHKPGALRSLARKYAEHLAPEVGERELSLADIRWTAVNRRTRHPYRIAVAASDTTELRESLASYAEGKPHARLVSGRSLVGDERARVVFVCSGQGPQWWAMGRQLLATEPVFRDVIEGCDDRIRDLGPWSLLEELGRDEQTSRIQETSISQARHLRATDRTGQVVAVVGASSRTRSSGTAWVRSPPPTWRARSIWTMRFA